MENKANLFISVTTFLLIMLWVYAAVTKLEDFTHFTFEMRNQVFPPFIQKVVVYFLPPVELCIAVLLLTERFFKSGMYLSLLLLSLFSGYIILIILDVFPSKPCSCGGILENMSWSAHLLFNGFYVSLIILSIHFLNKERKQVTNLKKSSRTL